jgi:hypothetical protein
LRVREEWIGGENIGGRKSVAEKERELSQNNGGALNSVQSIKALKGVR